MSYYIYAWLENGNPQLQIVESQSNSICLSWSYKAADTNYDKKEIQRLFRDLILLTCKQEMKNYRIFEVKPPVANESLYSLKDEMVFA